MTTMPPHRYEVYFKDRTLLTPLDDKRTVDEIVSLMECKGCNTGTFFLNGNTEIGAHRRGMTYEVECSQCGGKVSVYDTQQKERIKE